MNIQKRIPIILFICLCLVLTSPVYAVEEFVETFDSWYADWPCEEIGPGGGFSGGEYGMGSIAGTALPQAGLRLIDDIGQGDFQLVLE